MGRKPTGNPRGRPRADVDPEQVQELAAIGCTSDEIGAVCKCSKDVLERHYREQIDAGRADLRCRLRRRQIALAMEGNPAMLIWLGKVILGQCEEVVSHVDSTCTVAIQSSDGKVFIVEPRKAEIVEYSGKSMSSTAQPEDA